MALPSTPISFGNVGLPGASPGSIDWSAILGQAGGGGNPSFWAKALDFLKTPAGAAAISAIGGGLSASSARGQQEKDRELQQQQIGLQAGQNAPQMLGQFARLNALGAGFSPYQMPAGLQGFAPQGGPDYAAINQRTQQVLSPQNLSSAVGAYNQGAAPFLGGQAPLPGLTFGQTSPSFYESGLARGPLASQRALLGSLQPQDQRLSRQASQGSGIASRLAKAGLSAAALGGIGKITQPGLGQSISMNLIKALFGG